MRERRDVSIFEVFVSPKKTHDVIRSKDVIMEHVSGHLLLRILNRYDKVENYPNPLPEEKV